MVEVNIYNAHRYKDAILNLRLKPRRSPEKGLETEDSFNW